MRNPRAICVECKGERSTRKLRNGICNGCRNKKRPLVSIVCSVCGRSKSFRPSVITKADYYHCHKCHPERQPCPPGHIMEVNIFATPEFTGVTIRPGTPEELASVNRAKILVEWATRAEKAKNDPRILELEETLKKMPGGKILTLGSQNGEPLEIDMHEDGSFGYDPSHRAIFFERVFSALEDGGSMIVRQFTPFKSGSASTKDGRPLPVKRVYGILFADGTWKGLSRELVTEVCTTDVKTGTRIAPEDAVVYCEFPVRGNL